MTDEDSEKRIARRSIVTALGTGAVALGTAAASREASAASGGWQPALEEQDDWMELPGRHRMVFDSMTPEGAGQALFFARNFLVENQGGYGLDPSQLGVVVIVRHRASMFGYDDAMWAKYGETFSKVMNFTDPKTQRAPTRNLYDAQDYGRSLANGGSTFSDLAGKGVHFAVCGRSTRGMARRLASSTNGSAEEIYEEFAAHLVPNGHIVPAGIVTVNRAQERGYAFAYAG
jgi:intracellular sulfur oxidation DsrE/DsrF family protein